MSELYHHGVKGMKWGVRKKSLASRNRQEYRDRKNKAFAEYERSINDIERPYKRGQMLSERDQAREAAVEKRYSDAVQSAKADYKKAKQDRKDRIEQTTGEFRKSATRYEKLVFNDNTRRLAAKYVVDHNMSMADANKRAKSDAVRNTVLVTVAAVGAIAISNLK